MLPREYATEVQDLLIDPPEDNPYEQLKDQLISHIHVADSERQMIQQLLTAEELGDRKPTQQLEGHPSTVKK